MLDFTSIVYKEKFKTSRNLRLTWYEIILNTLEKYYKILLVKLLFDVHKKKYVYRAFSGRKSGENSKNYVARERPNLKRCMTLYMKIVYSNEWLYPLLSVQ